MPIGPARMPLFDHLGELRMRLVRIVACLAVAVVVFYMATPTMGQFLLMPIAEFLPNVDGMASLQAIDPFEAFSVRFQISLWAGIVATSPVILWQTPDASPVTMLLMFAAMIMLYEGSLLIARVVLRRRIKRQNEELAAEEDE